MRGGMGRLGLLLLAVPVVGACGQRTLGSGPVGAVDAGDDTRSMPTDAVATPRPDAWGTPRPTDAADATVDGAGPCPVTEAPPETFRFLSAGNSGTCGIHDDGTVACWGVFYFLEPTIAGTFKDISKQGGICGIRASGEIACWGNEGGASTPPTGPFEQVVLGEDAGCARAANGKVTCWGHMAYAPADTFTSLTGGAYYMCGIETDQSAAICWEPRVGAETERMVRGPFTQIDTGRFFACGLLRDGSATCWSTTAMADASILHQSPPAGPFQELSVGEFHVCGIRAGGELTCWGENRYGQATPPSGHLFAHVAAGSYHTCGIHLDGTVECWGDGPPCTL